ncbi:hypothetical protein JHK82_049755 [Glycine max]|uniref:Uncharacterized protein n=1 Tax=Glycine soja TaxID=3848 RepID=A0A445FR01_GLYSO|nr:hypothetical protein JHK86_049628 [Glycine max]KAG4923880.1 hypothetical protein JHK87_049420 [Glycine soja]KAG4935454.1 hypothetical protein JHK85_050373 [Glycine max]KAG5090977.1 hypothetical protein JHK82_049755 [Glycine max]KAG5094070.1 hypothetical protein JHK84_049658 [Glycine max]
MQNRKITTTTARSNLCPLGKCLTKFCYDPLLLCPYPINISSIIFPIMAEYSSPMSSCHVDILLCISQLLSLHSHA